MIWGGGGISRHSESDEISLLNEYARTKFAGEGFALTDPSSVVLRTNIVGFRHNQAPTFLEWAIGALKRKEKMTLFDDFYTSSIHVLQFAKIIFDVIKQRPNGIFNVASSTVASKKDFIIALSQTLFNTAPVNYSVGSVKSLGTARRANSLGLDVTKIENFLGYAMPDLDQVMHSIKREFVVEGL